MHTYLRTAALGAAALALVLSQQACAARRISLVDSPTTPAAGDSAVPSEAAPSTAPSAAPDKSATAAANGSARPPVLSGQRQVNIFPLYKGEEVPDSALSVQADGRVVVAVSDIADFGDRALFVPRPQGGGKYQILTGKLRTGGEPSCLAVRTNGSNPLTVVATACDARANQLFAFHNKGKDNQGRTTYAIENQSAYLQWNPTGHSGLIAEEVGDAPLLTTFVLIDRGPATLPALD
jgi:hypothetical protein